MTPAYDFHGRLSQAFPSQLIVDISEVCNLACIHCPHPQFKRSPHYGGRFLAPQLNTKLVDEVRDFGQGSTQYIRYSSEGEPLAHPHGYEMIEEAVKHSGVFVTLTTNGTIMNEKRTQRLLESGVHMIDISIDAFQPETYAKIRVGGNLEKTRRNILNLIGWVKESRAPTKIVVSFIEQPENRAEAADFKSYWEGEGVDAVVIRRLHSAAGSIAVVAKNMRASIENIDRRPCVYPWERMVLNPRGMLSFCPADWTGGSSIADYHTQTIRELWNGPFYQALRKAHLSGDFSNHEFCGQCPDWASTRWPEEGRGYANLIEDLIQNQNDSTRKE